MKKSMRQKFLLPISMVFLILFAATDLESPAFADPITSIQVGIYEGVLQRSFSYTPSHISIANKQGDIFECVQYGLDNCAISEPTARLSGVLVFPPCEESATGPCIEKVEFRLKERPWSAASLVRSIFAPKRQAENELGYPEGGSMSLWRSPQVPNSLGSGDYAVYVRSEGGTSPGAKWSFGNLTARIIPFKLIDGAFTEQRMVESKLGLITGYENLEGRSRLSQTTFAPYSVWSDRLGKGELAEWLPGTAARLTLKIPSTLGGWIGGRISDVEFSMSNESAKFNTLVIGGSSLAVNEVNVTIPVEKIPQKLREIYPITNPPTIAGYFLGGATHKNSFKVIEAIREFTADKSSQTRTYWGFESTDISTTRCLSDSNRIMGVVTTNALAYANSAPTFENGRLKYSVAGMHYDDAGEVIRGTYDLVLRSDAARCLYGFTDAPINAVVSVTYGDREQSVSTSVVGERNGWLYISAKNFTFSNPTIEVVISQPKGTPTSMVTSTTSRSNVNSKKEAESTKKVTITCIKGKVTKKFTGASPKCPEGFKRRG